MFVRCALKSASFAALESGLLSSAKQTCSAVVSKHVRSAVRPLSTHFNCRWAPVSNELKAVRTLFILPVRTYAAAGMKDDIVSQLDDMPGSTLKQEFAAVPLAEETSDVVRKLISLELASQKEKMHLKQEQMAAKVRLHEHDSSSQAVKVAILTARIRNYREHLHKHPKDKANKRRMLMCVDRRKKLLKRLRSTQYDVFENVCTQLGITYTFPPEYYRRVTRRWLAKKALCIKVFKELQKRRQEQRLKMAETVGTSTGEAANKASTQVQGGTP
ncbi:hypothetical protein GJAV_G00010130 [Gymnothorax javanicus]|nr:hypothetical protein GJAV_G00010130 [Gymnothorax javanicus]